MFELQLNKVHQQVCLMLNYKLMTSPSRFSLVILILNLKKIINDYDKILDLNKKKLPFSY